MNQAVGTLGDDVVGTSWLAKERTIALSLIHISEPTRP